MYYVNSKVINSLEFNWWDNFFSFSETAGIKGIMLMLFLIGPSLQAAAQYHWEGDRSKAESIEVSCSFVTKSNHQVSSIMTTYKFQKEAMSGTNIEVYRMNSKIHRIQTVTTAKQGWLIRDFYFQKGELVCVHTTIEFTEGNIPEGAPRNKYGQYFWDSSIFVEDESLVAYNYLNKIYALTNYDLSYDLEEAQKVYSFVVEHLED